MSWQTAPFLALDLETSGLDPDADRVLEVGWAWFEGGRLLERGGALTRPDRPVPEAVTDLTGIDDAMLASAPPFADVADEVVALLDEAAFVVAYHAAFDRAFLSRALLRAGRALPARRWIDPLPLIRHVEPQARDHRLSEVAARWCVRMERPHRAPSDAAAGGELLLRAGDHLAAESLDELVEQLAAIIAGS